MHVTTLTNQPYTHSSSVLEPIRNLAGFGARTKCTDSTPSAHQNLVALGYQHGNNTPTSPDKTLSHGSPQSEKTVTLSPVVAGLQRLPPPEQLGLVGRRQTQNIRQCLLDDILPSLTPLLMVSMHSPPQTAASQMQTHGTWEIKTYESQVFNFLFGLVCCVRVASTHQRARRECVCLSGKIIWICMFTHTHAYIRTHTRAHTYTCTHMCTRACVCTCIHEYMYTYVYLYVNIHVYIYIHMYMFIYMYTIYIYTYIHVYVYVYVCM